MRAKALRQAVNTVIQGTAADIMKMAIAGIFRTLPPSCPLLLTVHDSVLLEVPKGAVPEVAKLVRQVMEEAPPEFTVPLKADVKIGTNWAECKRAG